MTIEAERLRAWMAEKNLDEQGLKKAIGETRSIASFIDGSRRITESFKWQFGKTLGNRALAAVFGIDFGDSREAFVHGMRESIWYPEKYAAHGAVATAKRNGQLLPASEYKCHGCNSQAQHWHHQSYHRDDHLCVVPLCKPCHQKVHEGTLVLTYGVVPTSVGLIRIAIAGL